MTGVDQEQGVLVTENPEHRHDGKPGNDDREQERSDLHFPTQETYWHWRGNTLADREDRRRTIRT
jgi:hypothetical protein